MREETWKRPKRTKKNLPWMQMLRVVIPTFGPAALDRGFTKTFIDVFTKLVTDLITYTVRMMNKDDLSIASKLARGLETLGFAYVDGFLGEPLASYVRQEVGDQRNTPFFSRKLQTSMFLTQNPPVSS
jgi:hypothetical protein